MSDLYALFGGTFDPIHYGHLRPVTALAQQVGLQKVTLLPNNVPPHRPQNRVPRYQRQRLPAAAQANIASSATQRRSAPVEKKSQPSGSVSGASAR